MGIRLCGALDILTGKIPGNMPPSLVNSSGIVGHGPWEITDLAYSGAENEHRLGGTVYSSANLERESRATECLAVGAWCINWE